MENYCNEIGQKMRSAVKAKLLELGTGGSAGYIDDELPDYVMIMVANKRSKQQMITDLNLFLGTQTELFVTWLHEVLHKLQEVTLPATSVPKKRKTLLNDETTPNTGTTSSPLMSSKKNKKVSKKEKVIITKTKEQISTTPDKQKLKKPYSAKITDVFAEDLLEKSKQSLDIQSDVNLQIKKSKNKSTLQEAPQLSTMCEQPTTMSNNIGNTNINTNTNANNNATNEFDIPTISEISSTTETNANCTNDSNRKRVPIISGNRERDLAELAEIQKKIYAAKKQLKQLGDIDDDDKDFLNLKDDDSRETFNEAGDLVRKATPPLPPPLPPSPLAGSPPLPPSVPSQLPQPPSGLSGKKRSPIIFESKSNEEQIENENRNKNDVSVPFSKRRRFTSPPAHISSNENSIHYTSNDKRPVHERLGGKKPANYGRDNAKTSQAIPRERRKIIQDKELYVPAFRRKEAERERDRDKDRERERSRDHDRGRERGRERERRMDRSRDRDRDNSRVRSRHSRSLEELPKRRSNSEIRHIDERNYSQVGKITTTTPLSGKKCGIKSSSGSRETLSPDDNVIAQRKRIVSRVIIAPGKPVEASDEEDVLEKPVNSIIKIKPRPTLSPSKQAPKNLLLKAVAEAQRSTILHNPSTTIIKTITPATTVMATVVPAKSKISMRLGEKVHTERGTKLYTKSYRDRLKSTSGAGGVGALFRRTTQNLIVEVNGGLKNKCKAKTELKDEEYVPELVSDRGESDPDYVYVPQHIQRTEIIEMGNIFETLEYEEHDGDDSGERNSTEKTQFVVTLNEDKALPKLKRQISPTYSGSLSPPPQVTSSSSSRDRDRDRDREPTSTSTLNNTRKLDIKERVILKSTTQTSSSATGERKCKTSRHDVCGTPPLRRTELVEIFRKHKEVKKIIIQNDTDDEESMSPIKKLSPEKEKKCMKRKYEDNPVDKKRKFNSAELHESNTNSEKEKLFNNHGKDILKRPVTPPLTDRYSHEMESASVSSSFTATPAVTITTQKRKHAPIKYDLRDESKERPGPSHSPIEAKRRRSISRSVERDKSVERHGESQTRTQSRNKNDRDSSHERKEEKRKISIRNTEPKKYDNIPSSLNSVPVDSANYRITKPKERCKYHPNCTKTFCEYYHPSAPCKTFPNCTYGDKCIYSHPKCKYDLACVNLDCPFSHSGPRSASLLESVAPPLSSSVVPVQNYKTITANAITGPASSTTCKYFPNCTKTNCPFYHPKPCRWGKNCISKLECMFYHQELSSSSKFKWVASIN